MDTVTLAVFLSWLCGGFVAGVTSMGAALFAVPITAFFPAYAGRRALKLPFPAVHDDRP